PLAHAHTLLPLGRKSRFRLEVGDVFEDGDVFGEDFTVVELEGGHLAAGVDGEIVPALRGLLVLDTDVVGGKTGLVKRDARGQRTGERGEIKIHKEVSFFAGSVFLKRRVSWQFRRGLVFLYWNV